MRVSVKGECFVLAEWRRHTRVHVEIRLGLSMLTLFYVRFITCFKQYYESRRELFIYEISVYKNFAGADCTVECKSYVTDNDSTHDVHV